MWKHLLVQVGGRTGGWVSGSADVPFPCFLVCLFVDCKLLIGWAQQSLPVSAQADRRSQLCPHDASAW